MTRCGWCGVEPCCYASGHLAVKSISTSEAALDACRSAEADATLLAESLHRAVVVLEMMQTGYRLDVRDAAALVKQVDDSRVALVSHDERTKG